MNLIDSCAWRLRSRQVRSTLLLELEKSNDNASSSNLDDYVENSGKLIVEDYRSWNKTNKWMKINNINM